MVRVKSETSSSETQTNLSGSRQESKSNQTGKGPKTLLKQTLRNMCDVRHTRYDDKLADWGGGTKTNAESIYLGSCKSELGMASHPSLPCSSTGSRKTQMDCQVSHWIPVDSAFRGIWSQGWWGSPEISSQKSDFRGHSNWNFQLATQKFRLPSWNGIPGSPYFLSIFCLASQTERNKINFHPTGLRRPQTPHIFLQCAADVKQWNRALKCFVQ